MKTRPITVAETYTFARSATKIWDEAELAELVDYVAHNPEAGDVIQGTGGVRKLRWGKAGSGKRRKLSTKMRQPDREIRLAQ